MTKTFPCKEEGCRRTVVYERQELPASPGFNTRRLEDIRVFLTCEDEHVHAYVVTVADQSGGNG